MQHFCVDCSLHFGPTPRCFDARPDLLSRASQSWPMADTWTWPGWLEAFGSEAGRRMVAKVNRPLERGASAVEVQRGADEVLVWILGCLDNDPALRKKGIPSSLRKRLIEAYAEDVSLDPDRWGKLGKAKWHCWTPNITFGTRTRRAQPKQKTEQQGEHQNEEPCFDAGEGSGIGLPDAIFPEDILWQKLDMTRTDTTKGQGATAQESPPSDAVAEWTVLAAEHGGEPCEIAYARGKTSESLASNPPADEDADEDAWHHVGIAASTPDRASTPGNEWSMIEDLLQPLEVTLEWQDRNKVLQQLAKKIQTGSLRKATTNEWGGYQDEELESVGKLYSRHGGDVDAIAMSAGLEAELLRRSPPVDRLDFARKLLSGTYTAWLLGCREIALRDGVAFVVDV